MNDEERIENSALWAAYGDALGFMTEFATASLLRAKYGKELIDECQPWKRRVGGRFGVTANLPKGCYSDDTQLRLATSRAIVAGGKFDVEAFARVELPVWPAYALGGGRSTKAASAHLATAGVSWLTNFYKKDTVAYLSAGGNGVAMRIQPHVWAARDWGDPQTYVPSIVRNAISTHGHLRAVVGAVFHAITLAEALRTGRVPEPRDVDVIASRASVETERAFNSDKQIASLWLGVWERESGKSIVRALQSVGDDLLRDVRNASTVAPLSSSTATYNAVADRLGAYSESSRGSAMCTTVLAVYLAWLTRDTPEQAAVVSTNALGSDTDTVATMTCALLGATVERRPPQDPMDASYIAKEARRLANIRGQASTRETSFTYPDLLQWEAPRTQLDAVQLDPDGNYIVGGLGSVRSKGESYVKSSLQGSAVWQWLELEFGQNLLIKRRQHPRHMKMTKPSVGTGRRGHTRSPSLFEVEKSKTSGAPTAPQRRRGGGSGYISVEEAVRRSVKSDYDPLVVGESLLALADRASGVEWAVAFAAVIATRGKRVPRRLGGMPKAVAHQEPAQRIAEGFSLMTRVIDNRVYVAIKNDGESATFKGQIIRLSNVEDLSVPLPWAIRWKDATGDSLMIDRGQERLLELAQVHAAIRPNGKTGDVDRGAFEVFTPEGVVRTELPLGRMDRTDKPIEAILRVTTNNPRRSKSVTVLLSTSQVSQEPVASIQD